MATEEIEVEHRSIRIIRKGTRSWCVERLKDDSIRITSQGATSANRTELILPGDVFSTMIAIVTRG